MRLVLTLFLLLLPSSAFADCTAPVGIAGGVEYSSAESVFKYCNGTDWVPWAGQPVTGAPAPTASSSSSPGGSNNQIQFNANGAFAGDADLVWDSATGRLGINKAVPAVALDVVGDINYTGVTIDVSDLRFKENITPLEHSLEKLASVHGIAFTMKGDPKGQIEYGVAAQDVQKVFPELVVEVEHGTGMLGVNYNGLIAPMIEAIKQLKEENEALKARIETLEAKEIQP